LRSLVSQKLLSCAFAQQAARNLATAENVALFVTISGRSLRILGVTVEGEGLDGMMCGKQKEPAR
jgi:hypothetical protein